MRQLFVTQDFPPDVGGIQTYASELAPRLAAQCDRFVLVAPARPGDAEIDRALDFQVHRLRIRPDLLVLRAIPHILHLTSREQFDVAVHVQWQTAVASLLARQLTGSPTQVAVTLHGKDTVFNPFEVSPLASVYNVFRRKTLASVDRVLPVSRFLAGRARQLGASDSQITVVPNGTNPDLFYPDSKPKLDADLNAESRSLVLTAGRLVPKKGVDTALHAIDRVREDVSDVLLLIAGDGPERPRLDRLVRTLGLENHVQFLGSLSQEELRSYYSLADVFLMAGREVPGDIEGFGLVYLEANACGTPTVGARVGGVPDAIRDGETGLLVPPDDPAATADALVQLLTNPERARHLGEQGRKWVEMDANWDRVADQLFSVLNDKTR